MGAAVAVGGGRAVGVGVGTGDGVKVGVGVAVADDVGVGVSVGVGWRVAWGDATRDLEDVGVTGGTRATVVRSAGSACLLVAVGGAEGPAVGAGGAMVSTGAGVTPGMEVLHAASTKSPAINVARELPGRPMGLLSPARWTVG